MEHRQTFAQRVEVLKNLLIDRLKREGDSITYAEVFDETGLEVRSGKPNNAYLECYRAREECSKLSSQEPFFVEAVHGEGLQRLRIGQGHIKANAELSRTRKRSMRAIDWATTGNQYARSDEEATANRAMALIHTAIVAKTSPDQYRAEYTRISNGVAPSAPPQSLRDLLKATAVRRPWKQEAS